jgi:centromere-localized protein 2
MPNSTPTESSILRAFLLEPAPLSVQISLEQFTEWFPAQYQSSQDIEALYRALQAQVQQDIDEVGENITAEAKRGKKQMRQVKVSRAKEHQARIESLDIQDVQMDMEVSCILTCVYKQLLIDRASQMRDETQSHSVHSEAHDEESILPAMAAACKQLEYEILDIEEASRVALQELKATVGELSDLRYGRLPKTGNDESLGSDVVYRLQRLEKVCQEVGL